MSDKVRTLKIVSNYVRKKGAPKSTVSIKRVLVIGACSFDDCVQSEVVRALRVELQLRTYEELIKSASKAVDDW